MSLLIFYVVILIIKKIYKGRIQDEFAGKWYFLLIISAMSIASEYILSIDKGIAYITVIEISFIILLINVILYFFLSFYDRTVFITAGNGSIKEANGCA